MLRNLNQSSAGQRICGTPQSGVLGALIPSTGDNGPGFTYNDLSLPADSGKEIRGAIITWPSAGTLTAFENTSFEFAAPDGEYSFQYQLYVDGVATGSPATVALQIGAANHTSSAALVANVATIAGAAARSASGVVPHDATAALVADDAVVTGSAERLTSHATSGALAASAASIAGSANRLLAHTASGSLVADSSLVSGAADRSTSFITHDATAAFVASVALMAGTAARNSGGTGTGPLSPADIEAIADAVMLRLGASFIPVDVKRVNGITIIGDGSSVPFQV